jgi:preprotein translocase subunit SecE
MGCIIFVKPYAYEGKESMANKDFWEEYGKELAKTMWCTTQ